MKENTEELFRHIKAAIEAEDPSAFKGFSKSAAENPLDNSFWANLIDGALKGLDVVAMATMDIKLFTISKLLQSWLKEKREEKAKQEQDRLRGVNYNLTHPNTVVTQYDSYGGQPYY